MRILKMTHLTLMDKYPINKLIIKKNETTYTTVDAIVEELKKKIEAHPVAIYIATFDHYTHTKSLAEGEINDDILDAKNVICCFGKQLPKATMLAIRPRAIGIAELVDSFVLSFMDAPNPQAQEAMIKWVEAIKNKI